MAGKGRGVGSFTFNIEALGIGRGSMPEARVGPSPLFPSTDVKPVPLKAGEDEDYMLALKQEMRGTMQRLPHNIKHHNKVADVERYTERYLRQKQIMAQEWTPDWSCFPKELMPQKRKPWVKAGAKKTKTVQGKDTKDVLTKLDELAKVEDGKTEKSDDETEKKPGEEDDEEEGVGEEEYEEEDIEEDNDYIESYFDNGEDFAADSDDNMDGEATY
ncbi:DNA-directed RNA polymerase III subunit RPC7 isoform X2 [Cynoglossus semilaevis]|nr:DNA-directed RNA polymerase III subunit RPC7 isoform X2 [Cynoglossus semilaevis]